MRAILPILLCLATPALADEVWTTPEGTLEYLEDIGSTAVLAMPLDGTPIRVYVPGLGGETEYRMTYMGYWVGDDPVCGGSMVGDDGTTGKGWGEAVVSFEQPSGPSDVTLVLGYCFERPGRVIPAHPMGG